MSHEDIQKADTNDALTPDRADRCKVGTELCSREDDGSRSLGAWQEWLHVWWTSGSREIL